MTLNKTPMPLVISMNIASTSKSSFIILKIATKAKFKRVGQKFRIRKFRIFNIHEGVEEISE